jgi:hypothetical protein
MSEHGDLHRRPDSFNPRDVVSAREIVQRLPALTVQRVHDLRRGRLGFPEPIGRRGHEFVWYWPEVHAWARLRRAELSTGDAS